MIGCPKMERLFLLAEISVDVSEGVYQLFCQQSCFFIVPESENVYAFLILSNIEDAQRC